eukprot:jgi/Chlat1/6763/Chrsp50S06484
MQVVAGCAAAGPVVAPAAGPRLLGQSLACASSPARVGVRAALSSSSSVSLSRSFFGKDLLRASGDRMVRRRRAPLLPPIQAVAQPAAVSSDGDGNVRDPLIDTQPTAHSVPGFKAERLKVFASIVIGYSCYYITRNSLTFTAPAMVASPDLKLDITSIGVITSIFPMFYGFSKFLSGVISQKVSSRLMLAGGLFLTGAINAGFGLGSTLGWFSVFWAMNGLLQGFGAPSCAKILTSWFATKERGTYWGMWNIAHNLGGFSAPIIAGTCAKRYGWRWGMWTPGLIGLVVGTLLLFFTKDSPESAGYPPVEHVMAKNKDGTKAKDPEDDLSLLQNLWQNVLSNPYIWGLALTYFCIYLIRQGITSWSVFYLIDQKGVPDAASAAVRVSGLELGGLTGSLVAGFLSDKLAANSKSGTVGKRLQVVMAYTVGIAAMLAAFWAVPASAWGLQIAIVFMIGFFLYGPQMLIGLCGAELVGRKSVGASEGFLGWVAYLGAANAGVPLSIIVKNYGWPAFFKTLFGACGVALLLLAPMTNAKSFVEREAAKQSPALAT